MQPTPSLPMLQFLTWIDRRDRTHADIMDAWQSSCPRLSVWEDAVIDGYVQHAGDAARSVVLTRLGRTVLDAQAALAARAPPDTLVPADTRLAAD